MAAALPYFTESLEPQIDDLLMRICVELQLDDAKYNQAEANYQGVGRWLESQNLLVPFRPAIYPQGSMLLGTTVKPLIGNEYDLDFVCELACGTDSFQNATDALALVEEALRANRVYHLLLERKNRCVRINYAPNFHMDILPACKDQENGDTCILVPDRQLQAWTASNPKGFGFWFESQSQQVVQQLAAKAAPIPVQQLAQRKPPLKLCVQLWKRWRDLFYRNDAENAPISIVLTTLAGLMYRGENSVTVAMGSILQRTVNQIKLSHPRLIVLNPSNHDEDLSERWDSKPVAYRAFVNGLTQFEAQWKLLLNTRGLDKIAKLLEGLFGEDIARRVVKNQVRNIEDNRAHNQLGIQKTSGIVTTSVGAAVQTIRPTTFYGEK